MNKPIQTEEQRDSLEISKHESLILHAISTLDAATRRGIADYTSLSLVSVSSALNTLENAGIIIHNAKSKSGGGRPTHFYSFKAKAASFFGVSINPDNFRAVVIGADGSFLEDTSYPLSLSDNSSAHVYEIVNQVADVFKKTKQTKKTPILSVGITLPGVTDSQRGVWVEGFQVNGISQINIRDLFAQSMGVPVHIEDPARATAFYEVKKGIGKGNNNFVLMYLGYGVGAGIVLDGHLYRGSGGLAGEIGHIIVDPAGFRCSCGDVGCLETIASSTGILRMVKQRLNEGVVSSLGKKGDLDNTTITIDDLYQSLVNGDRLAESIMYEVGAHIGNACAITIKLLNPSLIIISGEVSKLQKVMENQVNAVIRNRVMPSLLKECRIEFGKYEVHDEAYGAALLASENHWAMKAGKFGNSNKRELPPGS